MDTFVTTAIVGTGQHNSAQVTTSTPVDLLTQQLAASPERTLLLTAGALHLYRQAGQTAILSPALPLTAPAETLPACSTTLALLISGLFTAHDQRDLLFEALHRLANARQRLPYTLLPLALTSATAQKDLRPSLIPVLGERGYWLAVRNPHWSWVQTLLLKEEERVPATAQTLWQEGSAEQRVALLRLLRVHDPAQARDWLSAVWKQEKAPLRVSFLETFATGLSASDEPFLEQALDDRGESVRTTAIALLNRLPDSAHLQRLTRLANSCLSCSGPPKNTLVITLPETYDKTWQRDGISQINNLYIDARSWWLQQILASIPPTYWEKRFAMTATQLVEVAAPATWQAMPLNQVVISAWAEAALAYRTQSWLLPLWEHDAFAQVLQQTRLAVIATMSQAAAEKILTQVLQNFADEKQVQLLLSLPAPWSETFAQAYLSAIHTYLSTIHNYASNHYIVESLHKAAFSLPSASFPAALRLAEIEIKKDAPHNVQATYYQNYVFDAVQLMLEKIKMRMTLMKEIV